MHITDKLYNKKWGIFNHYIYRIFEKNNMPWEEMINNIDVKKIAKQLHEIGAGYYFITLCQGTKHILTPNDTYNKILGAKPGEICSERDIVLELYDELSQYNIDLYLYFPSDGPHFDEEYGKKIGFYYNLDDVWNMKTGELRPDEENKVLVEKRLSDEYIKNWSSVLLEYATRYGDKISGWWLDGFYTFFGFNNDNMKPFYDAIKRGNPNAIVAFNGGVKKETVKWYKNEDFTAGEFNEFSFIPKSRFTVDGAQNHILAPLGSDWGAKDARVNSEYMKNYIKSVNDSGGVVTVDVGVFCDGSFSEEQMNALKF